jgi:hypothetical protein
MYTNNQVFGNRIKAHIKLNNRIRRRSFRRSRGKRAIAVLDKYVKFIKLKGSFSIASYKYVNNISRYDIQFFDNFINYFDPKGVFCSIYKEVIPYSIIVYDWDHITITPILVIDLDLSNVKNEIHRNNILKYPEEYLVPTMQGFRFRDLQHYFFCATRQQITKSKTTKNTN